MDPEVVANVWEEDSQSVASVSLNGKDLLTYKCSANGHTAEERAEDLAAKLRELLGNSKFDCEKLLPAREGNLVAVKTNGCTVLKFDPSDMDSTKSILEQGYTIVNRIRAALGTSPLPSTFLKIAELTSQNTPNVKAKGNCFSGHASWYGGKFHGRKAADGSRFDQDGLTAAHRSLPFGTKLLVMNRRTGQSCVVQVNDRGPFVGGRVIDLSRGAARQLNMLSSGVAMVDCLVLGKE
jgi:rare lipoprotein A